MSEPPSPPSYHEKAPSTPSIKSTLSVPSRDSGLPRRVGFQRPRPTLKIPPPQTPYGPKSATLSMLSGAPSTHTSQNYGFYGRKQSMFMFNGIKDFTKSGLGIGEKSALWLYTKLRAWSRKWFTHLFLSIVLVIYTIGGALMFITVEGYNEDQIVIPNLQKERYLVIRNLREFATTIPQEKSVGEYEGRAYRRIREFEEKIIESFLKDQLIVANGGERKIWTFWNAVVYCSTIYTSIGYGHIYPTTLTGRALTIVYSLIGIPLFLLALTDFGKLFTRCIKFLWSFVRRLYYTGSCRRVRKQAQVQEIFKGAQMMYDIATFRRPSAIWDPEQPQPVASPIGEETPTTPALSNFEIDDQFNLPISVAILILLMYIFFGAFFYGFMEGWNFFKSFYFVFISMSTIGFGDVVPNNPLCTIISIVYLVFGLALMSMCINVVQEKLSDTFKSASAKIGASMGLTMAAEDGSIHTVPPEAVELPPIHEKSDQNLVGDVSTPENTSNISFEEMKNG
ncbi:hypothetical protein HHI36_009412 [Cryptolaemus montrouzieri]|uniref:Potassium channel domain-containing protein n=1 Tax=Cryptolaemus montrouzieri TaxID=559131 RepID=A0ABD2MW09_9CUCU